MLSSSRWWPTTSSTMPTRSQPISTNRLVSCGASERYDCKPYGEAIEQLVGNAPR